MEQAQLTSGRPASEFFVFESSRYPLRVQLSRDSLERMEAEVAPQVSQPNEIGGLLIGRKRSDRATVQIVDFIPLAGEQGSGHFRISSTSMAEVIARCPSDCRIVGHYRTATDRCLQFRPEDLEVSLKWFKDPGNIFLVVANTAAGPSGGFFPWEGEAIAPSPFWTFPFSVDKLAAEEWPTASDLKEEKGIRSAVAARISGIGNAVRHASIPATVGVIAALLIVAVGIRMLLWSLASKPRASASLGLEVQRAGSRFLIQWNPSVREIREAKGANLVISEPQTGNHPSEPVMVTLNEAQLRSGSTTYAPLSFTGRAKFRLDVIDASGTSTSESVSWVSPAYTDTPSKEPPTARGQPQR